MHSVNTNFQAHLYNLKSIFFPRYIYFLHFYINPDWVFTHDAKQEFESECVIAV